MDQLFSVGKSLFKNKSKNSDSDSGSGGLNPMAMFKQLDRNGDGKITEDDFVLAIASLGLGSVGESAVRGIFKQIDTNRNGKLDLSEAMSGFEKIKSIMAKSNTSQ